MSLLDSISFNVAAAAAELKSFKAWPAEAGFVSETVIVSELKSRPQMACLLAASLGVRAPNLIKFEMWIKGMFRTDLVLGNAGLRQFCLIEFEDAMPNSIFKAGKKQYRAWSPRVEHGFSQIVDWAWVRSDHPNDTVLVNGFGGRIDTAAYAVISGRGASLNGDTEQKRFAHRHAGVKVEGVSALLLTYDEMVRDMADNLSILGSFI